MTTFQYKVFVNYIHFEFAIAEIKHITETITQEMLHNN